MEEAAHLLTYPYGLRGSIVSGYKVGRKLGFPTANIQVDEPFKIIPGIGVYAVRVYLNGLRYKGMQSRSYNTYEATSNSTPSTS